MGTKLTDYHIDHKCKPGTITWDLLQTGLGLRMTPKGKPVWVLKLVFPGQTSQSRRTLGSYPGMSIADARSKAKAWYDLTKAGEDPVAVEAKRRERAEREARAAKLAAEREAGNTFGSVAERFMAGRTNKRVVLDKREIDRTLTRQWGSTPIATITPRDVRLYIGELAKRKPAEARNAWGHLTLIMKWAVHEELIEASPCASLDKGMVLSVKVAPRQRTLNDDEIFALWRASHRMGYPEGALYRMLLLTGCRLEECMGATWRELHPELRRVLRVTGRAPGDWSQLPDVARVWSIPPERGKSGEVRLVPLTDAVIDLLATLPHRGEFLFSHTGGKLWSSSRKKRELDRHMSAILGAMARKRGDVPATLADWVLHDLRRVVRTGLAALGVADNVAELTIGHAKTGLQRVYDQHRYLPEMRAALTKWADRLAELVGVWTTVTRHG